MPVYSVDLSTTVVVQAVDAVDAFRKAMREQRTICTEGDMTIDVGVEIRSLSELTSMWDGECLPYGGDGNTRLKDLLPNAEVTGGPLAARPVDCRVRGEKSALAVRQEKGQK